MADVYQEVTDKILNALENGVVPWRKPWKGGAGSFPQNMASKKQYRGINVLLLMMEDYDSPNWVTYKQARSQGGHVKKGEKGTRIVFWKFLEKEDKEGEKKKIPMARSYTVFNTEQCEDLEEEDKETEHVIVGPEAAQNLVDAWSEKPEVRHGGGRAYYIPTSDLVRMPNRQRFDDQNEYYSTLFHEFVHSTGHTDRLSREGVTKTAMFGSHEYSKEELVAEMGAAFLSAKTGINNTLNNSAAYIKGWLIKLQSDKRLLLSAASQAQKATDYITGD